MDNKKDLKKLIITSNKNKSKLKKEFTQIKKAYVNRRKKIRQKFNNDKKREEIFKADKAENNQAIFYHNKIKEQVYDPIIRPDFKIEWNKYR